MPPSRMLRILGPNCIGMLVPHLGLNASFAHIGALPGELAFVTQSGALMTAMLDWARSRRIGFSHLVSLGEHADVDFGDMLDYLGSDAKTRAILLYIESIEAPRKFMSAARGGAQQTGDRREVGPLGAGPARRGLAHGALAGSDIVYDAAIARRHAARGHHAAALPRRRDAGALSRQPRRKLVILTNGGGAGVMAADCAAHTGVELAELSADSIARLDAQMPANWSRGNPVDIIGDAPAERYVQALEAINADRGRRHAVRACAHRHRAERRHRARWCRWPARARRACSAAGWAAIRWRRRGASSARPASPASRRPRRRCAPSRCW